MTRVGYILLGGLLCTGCGVYSFTGHGIAGIESIAVDPFDNRTAEFGIREDLTEAIITRLLADRSLTLTDRNNADAVLKGVLIDVNDRPLTFQTDETVTEYQITITVEFSLMVPGKTEPIWEGRISGIGSYPYRSGGLEERRGGITEALDRIAQDLINRLTSDW